MNISKFSTKNILMVGVFLLSNSVFALNKNLTLNNTQKDMFAVPNDTPNVTLMLCNLSESSISWAGHTGMGNDYPKEDWYGVILATGRFNATKPSSCNMLALRRETGKTITAPVMILIGKNSGGEIFDGFAMYDIKYTYEHEKQNTSFKVRRLINKPSKISIYSATEMGNSDYINKNSGIVYQNLHGGVVPDFVICYGGTPAQCKNAEKIRD